jgi:PST family polysaccharide transporter
MRPLKVLKRRELRRAIANIAWLGGESIFRLILGFFLGIWIARYLGPQVFGQYSYALALVALFGIFSRLGIDNVLVREIVRSRASRNELLGSAFALKFVGGMVALAAVVCCAVILRPSDPVALALVAIIGTSLVAQSIDVIDMWFQSQLQSRRSVVARNTALLITAALKIWLMLAGAGVTAFALAALGELVLGGLGLLLAYRLSGESILAWRWTWGRSKELLLPSFPLIFAGLAVSLYMRIDQVMISSILGDFELGAYSAAIRLTEAAYFIPSIVSSSAFPAIISLRASNPERFKYRMQWLFDVMVVLALAIAFPLSIFADSVVHLLYGDAYATAASVLRVHAWSTLFVFLGVTSSSWLLAENLTAVSFYRTAIGAVANIALNIVLIPTFGVVGAAWATLLSMAIATFGVFVDSRSRAVGAMMLKAFFPVRIFLRRYPG